MSRTIRRPHPGRTAVYRFYDRRGALLYIGITNSPRHRFAQHADPRDGRPWWGQVDESRTTIEWYSTRNQALRVEEHSIKSELPMHNKVHHPAWGGTHVGERPTDRVARPIALAVVCGGLLLGSISGWWSVPIGPQVVLGFLMVVGLRTAFLRM